MYRHSSSCTVIVVVVVVVLVAVMVSYLHRKVVVETPTEILGATAGAGRGLYIAVVYNNDGSDGCVSAWGHSLYIRYNDTVILFDADPDPKILINNARTLDIDFAKLKAVVISHEYGDHINSLEAVASIDKSIPIYIPKGMSGYAKEWIGGPGA